MVKNFIFILTEGIHDSAFIYRILKTNGMKTQHGTHIKDYTFPLNDIIKLGIESTSIEELNIQEAKSKFLPSYIMQKDDNLLIIYEAGGDSKEKVRVDFIKNINKLNIPEDADALDAMKGKGSQFSVLFFYDADDNGIDKRIEQIKKELKVSFSKSKANDIDNLKNKEKLLIEGINVGAFIFVESGQDIGKLEDILIPLMKKENDDIFEAAEEFLDIRKKARLFEDTKAITVDKKEYVHKKSLLGALGQLQISGVSNAVCIGKADYLNDNKIKSDATCVEIYDFIKIFLHSLAC